MGYPHQIRAAQERAVVLFSSLSIFFFEASAVQLQTQTSSRQSVEEKAETTAQCKCSSPQAVPK